MTSKVDTRTTSVKGYLTKYMIDNSLYETLYFSAPCGTIAETELIKCPNDEFNVVGKEWYLIKELPSDAEYIGNYKIPAFLIEVLKG